MSSRQRSSLGQSVHRHPQPHGKACKHYGGEAVLPVDKRSALRNRYGRFVPFSLRPCACFHLCCIFCGTDRIKRSAVRVVGKPRCRHFGCHVNKAARQAERLCPPTNTATFRHRKIPLRRRPCTSQSLRERPRASHRLSPRLPTEPPFRRTPLTQATRS